MAPKGKRSPTPSKATVTLEPEVRPGGCAAGTGRCVCMHRSLALIDAPRRPKPHQVLIGVVLGFVLNPQKPETLKAAPRSATLAVAPVLPSKLAAVASSAVVLFTNWM